MPNVDAIGTAQGSAFVQGFTDFESSPDPFAAVGTAAGQATVQGYTTEEAVGTAEGAATVSGVGEALSSEAVGTAAGGATVIGAGQVVIARKSTNPKTYLLHIADKRDGAGGISEIDFVLEDLSVYPYDIFPDNPLLGA